MWQSIISCQKLQTGDVIEMSGKTLFFKHYGVIFYKNGITYVAHNPKEGPKIDTLEDLEKERTIYNCFRNEITKKLTDKYIEEKTIELQPYGYSFMEMNCEDFVKRVVGTYIGLDDRYAFTIVISLVVITILTVTIAFLAKRNK